MVLDESALFEGLEVLEVADVSDRIRQAAETMYQALFEADMTVVIGAAPHERNQVRTALRNGHRPRTLTTPAGIWSCGSLSYKRGLLPVAVKAASDGGSGVVRGGDGGLPAWRVDSQGR
jgi:hypothetical protein